MLYHSNNLTSYVARDSVTSSASEAHQVLSQPFQIWYHFLTLCQFERSIIPLKVTAADILTHYNDVIMSAMASQVIIVLIVYSIVCSVADQRKLRSSDSLAFVRGIRRWTVNSPHKGPVTRKMFPFDDVIICTWQQCVLLPQHPIHHCHPTSIYM